MKNVEFRTSAASIQRFSFSAISASAKLLVLASFTSF